MLEEATKDRRRKESSHADIESELVVLSFRGLLPTAILGLIGLAGATVVVARVYHDWFLYGLAVAMVVTGMTRILWVRRLAREDSARLSFCTSWWQKPGLTALMFVYYNTLSVSTLWNFHHHRPPAEGLCTIGVLFLCLGINGRIPVDPNAAKLYGVALLGVLLVCVYRSWDPIALTADTMIVMFSVAHCHAVQEKFDIVVEQTRSARKLRLLSEQDALTGLMNRRGFTLELENLCKRGAPFAVLYIDLDHFKPVNDELGHAAGDDLLRAVGVRLVSLVRAGDVVARLGGDEFAILQMPLTERSQAEALAARVNAEIGADFVLGETMVRIGATVGVAVTSAKHVEACSLLAEADSALYRAKAVGRGSYVCAMV